MISDIAYLLFAVTQFLIVLIIIFEVSINIYKKYRPESINITTSVYEQKRENGDLFYRGCVVHNYRLFSLKLNKMKWVGEGILIDDERGAKLFKTYEEAKLNTEILLDNWIEVKKSNKIVSFTEIES